MRKIQPRFLTGFVLLLLVLPAFPNARPTYAQTGGSQTFAETGQTVSGKILDFWNSHGGIVQLGLPISAQMQDVSSTDGKTYSLQYFERAVLELHPENSGTPFEVQGALVGNQYYLNK